MAAASLVLAVWSRDLNSAVYNYVYVDDRLLFTESDSSELQHAFGRTEAWDTLHNFRTQIKTCQIRDVKKSTAGGMGKLSRKSNRSITLAFPWLLGSFPLRLGLKRKCTELLPRYNYLQGPTNLRPLPI